MLQVAVCSKRKRGLKSNLTLNKEKDKLGCVSSSCRSALMQQEFRVRKISLGLHHPLSRMILPPPPPCPFGLGCLYEWLYVCVLMCSVSAWPRKLCRAQFRTQLCDLLLWKMDHSRFWWFRQGCLTSQRTLKLNSTAKSCETRVFPHFFRAKYCQATRGKQEVETEERIICHEHLCQGNAASVVHYYWRRPVCLGGGWWPSREPVSHSERWLDRAKGGSACGASARISMLTAGVKLCGLSGRWSPLASLTSPVLSL